MALERLGQFCMNICGDLLACSLACLYTCWFGTNVFDLVMGHSLVMGHFLHSVSYQ